MLLTLPFIGAMGFHLIEGWGWFDSLYMSLITLTTVGYMEVHPLSEAGRAFVMVLLVLGLSVFIYSLAALGEVIVRTELYGWRGNRQMTRALEEIQHHFIICGAGRMGWALALELADQSLPFVIVERDETILDRCRDRGWLAVEGDATDDDILAEAGLSPDEVAALIAAGVVVEQRRR